MKSHNPSVKTVYVSLFILTIGLSVIHLPTFTLNEVSAKYSSNFEQTASLANDCLGHGDITCINDNP